MRNLTDRMNTGNGVAYTILGAILILTLFLRLYGIDWGLPTPLHPNYSYHPDETALLTISQWLARGGLHEKEFIYGGTFYFVILRACAYFGNIFHEFIGGANALANAILAARYLQVFIALLTMLIIYECGRLLYDRKTGLIAALILAVAPAHIITTQTVRPDAISAFLVTLAVLMAAKLLKSESSSRTKLLMYSGITIGTLAAFRLPLIGFGLLPILGYIIAQQRTNGGAFRKLVFDRNVFWLALVVVLTYAVLSPHTFIHPEWFMAGLKVTAKFETTAFPDAVDRGPVFFQYAWRLLHQALGYPGYFLAVGGVAYALVQRRAENMIVLVGFGLYFIMLAAVTWTVVRYTLPMLPLLALLGGVAASRIIELMHPVYARGITYIIGGFFLAWTLAADIALLHVEASKNVRVLSSEWITENLPSDKSILVIKSYLEEDFFNPVVPPPHRVSAAFLINGSDSRRLFAPQMFDYLVLHELLYADMERLGERHPRKEVSEFYENMKSAKLTLVKEYKVPFEFLDIDFSGWFEAVDFLVINPGIRIYQNVR
jgi:4-amino-4-deoxy-L-arabinose transferase-like glycosyltransferase